MKIKLFTGVLVQENNWKKTLRHLETMDSDLTRAKSSSIGAAENPVQDSENKTDVPKSASIPDDERVVEVSPNSRYSRFNTILGKGAFKVVWKAIDREEGIEVAWNTFQVSFYFNFSRPQRLK